MLTNETKHEIMSIKRLGLGFQASFGEDFGAYVVYHRYGKTAAEHEIICEMLIPMWQR